MTNHDQSPQAVFCNSTKEIGEFLGVLADALRDGKISPNEAKQILAESEDVRGVLDNVEILCARAG